MTTPDPFEHLDAVYVFGALDPAETAQFETHLTICPECTARVEAARGVTALLADISVDELMSEVPAQPQTLLPGLLRKAAASRRRQRWLVSGLAAVVAACLVTLTVLIWPASSPHGRTIAMTKVVHTPVTATVELRETSSGTEIKLHCTYAAAGNSQRETGGVEYALTVRDKHGQTTSLSTWTISPGEDKWYPATTALQENQISQLAVTYQGRPILTAKL